MIALGHNDFTPIQCLSANRLVALGHNDFTACQLMTANRLVGLNDNNFLKQHLVVAENLITLGFNNFTRLDLLEYSNSAVKFKVLEGMVADIDSYNRIDSLAKLRTILSDSHTILNAEETLLFAKRVNSEHLHLHDINAQIGHAVKTYILIYLKNKNPADNNDCLNTLDDRREIYAYMNEQGMDNTNDVDFTRAISNIRRALNLGKHDRLKLDEDLSINSGLQILKFNNDLTRDWQTLKNRFENRLRQLMDRLTTGAQYLHAIARGLHPAPHKDAYFIDYCLVTHDP